MGLSPLDADNGNKVDTCRRVKVEQQVFDIGLNAKSESRLKSRWVCVFFLITERRIRMDSMRVKRKSKNPLVIRSSDAPTSDAKGFIERLRIQDDGMHFLTTRLACYATEGESKAET